MIYVEKAIIIINIIKLNRKMGALVEINTDGLAKLGETISYALGGTARGARKMADAKAYAAELEAKTKNKVALIEAQGQEFLANYVVAKETRKFNNTMAVIDYARTFFSESEQVSAEPVDDGWKNRFFGIVEEISDEEFDHEIEVKKPKSYSLRTLETLRNLTKEEAAVIVKAASFTIGNESIYKNSTLSMSEKLLLQEIGLMLDDGIGIEYKWDVKENDVLTIVLDDGFLFALHNDNNHAVNCHTEVYKLSTAGREIFKLVNIDKVVRESFYHTLATHFKKKGITHVYKHKIAEMSPSVKYFTKGEEII